MTQRFFVGVVFALGQLALAQQVAIVPKIPSARTPVLPAALPEPLLRVESNLVLVPAHVTNVDGLPLTDLSVTDFHLQEDNVAQTIASFSAEDAPISVGLLFDASGSMRNKMDKASEAAARFFATANTGDEFFLVEIGGRVKVLEPFTTDSNQILDRIRRIKP